VNRRVLLAGIGNVFLGDDGFGVEVARRLLGTHRAPGVAAPDVTVADYGIRGLHLAYDMLAGRFDTTILIDAICRKAAPGTLYVFEPDPVEPGGVPVDAHGMHPAAVLALLRRLGGEPGRILVLGCEPACLEEGVGLSPPVAAAVDEAVIQAWDLARNASRCFAPGPETAARRP
jgi:hydrogenase maturation protease